MTPVVTARVGKRIKVTWRKKKTDGLQGCGRNIDEADRASHSIRKMGARRPSAPLLSDRHRSFGGGFLYKDVRDPV